MRTPYTGAPVEYQADDARETTFCRHLIECVVGAITFKSSDITEKLPTKKEARRLGADHGHLLNEKQGTVRMDQFIRVGCDNLIIAPSKILENMDSNEFAHMLQDHPRIVRLKRYHDAGSYLILPK